MVVKGVSDQPKRRYNPAACRTPHHPDPAGRHHHRIHRPECVKRAEQNHQTVSRRPALPEKQHLRHVARNLRRQCGTARKNVQDPNSDLFLEVPDENEDLLKQAIDASGSIALDDKDLLRKYEKLLKDYRFARKQNPFAWFNRFRNRILHQYDHDD